MPVKRVAKVLAVIALSVAAILPGMHINAAGALIGQFYAGCSNFSVEVAVTGNTDDGAGQDRFWYQISDFSGKVLYTEYATRPLNITGNSVVVNLGYTNGQPTVNPVTFEVVELDSNNSLGAILATASYDAPCLAASTRANRSGAFVIPKVVVGTILANTPLYSGPGGESIGLTGVAGSQQQVVYRSSDGQWVAIWVGGNNLVWIPAADDSADVNQLALPPTRIDYSSFSPSNQPITPSTGTGGTTTISGAITGVVRAAALNVHSGPNSNTPVIDALTGGTTVSILGRDSTQSYLKISYNNTTGWASAFYITLSAGTVGSLPVVQ